MREKEERDKKRERKKREKRERREREKKRKISKTVSIREPNNLTFYILPHITYVTTKNKSDSIRPFNFHEHGFILNGRERERIMNRTFSIALLGSI